MATFLRRVTLRHYRSIAKCQAELGPFTLLVGPNGAGKSNFLDALRLVTDALSSTLEHALRQRGGVAEVRRRSSGHPNHFTVRLDLNLASGTAATYAFEVGALQDRGFSVRRERAWVADRALGTGQGFIRNGDSLEATGIDLRAKVSSDRLYLTAVSGIEPFHELFDALTRMGFYNLDLGAIRSPQDPDSGELLRRDGSNMASVLARLARDAPDALDRINEYMRQIVPGSESVRHKSLGSWETVELSQRMAGARSPWWFSATSMSDGTLRALGLLLALFQTSTARRIVPTLVGIEEPESAIHPGAAAVVVDAMIEASASRQVMATTHSPEILEHDQISDAVLLSVENNEGESIVAPIDLASRRAIRERLFSPGELLRAGQLAPDASAVPDELSQTDLFAEP